MHFIGNYFWLTGSHCQAVTKTVSWGEVLVMMEMHLISIIAYFLFDTRITKTVSLQFLLLAYDGSLMS
jgi:hypothetical protein